MLTDVPCSPVVFEAVVAGTDEIRFWVMGWGSHAEVLEPENLREGIMEEVEQVSEMYNKGAVMRKTF